MRHRMPSTTTLSTSATPRPASLGVTL